ncbi:hypothetical protein SUDANB15_02829 [Streptomyces sp. enrichment culture]
MPVGVSLDLARLVGERAAPGDAVRTPTAVAPEAVACARTSGSSAGGAVGERAVSEAVSRAGAADAPFPSCTNPPTCDVIPPLEAELRIPVISANQVTVWAALRRLGTRAVGPYQALIDRSARSGTVLPGQTSGAVPPEEEKQQEGWS